MLTDKYGEATDSSLTGQSNKPAGYNIKSVTAELEKRRAELFALARAAEARAREAEEKCEQAETRLEQEMNQRLLADQRLMELEEDRLRQQQAVEIEGMKALKVALAHEEMEARLIEAEDRVKEAENKVEALTLALTEADQKRAEAESLTQVAKDDAREIELFFDAAEVRLKDVESRLMEAETRVKEETEARRLAENALLEAENKGEDAALALAEAETATIALTEANQKRAEAEATARAAEEKCEQTEIRLAQEIDQRSLVEQRLRELEEEYLGQQQAKEIEELKLYDALQAREEVEARLKDFTLALAEAEAATIALAEQKTLAEQKLKEFEDELSSYLELDWSKSEPDMTQVSVVQDGIGAIESMSQLLAQVEAEQKARREAEDARAAIELEMWEMGRALRNAEEKNRQQEDDLKKFLQIQEAKPHPIPEQVGFVKAKFTSLNLLKSVDEDHTYSVEKQKGLRYEFKFIVYGMVISLLLVAAFWLITAAFLQV